MNTTQWKIDPTHSEIGFKIKHMMFTNVSGKFNTYDATVSTPEDRFEEAQIIFKADVASIDTGNTDRDNHLKSADFFDADNFPEISFTLKSLHPISGEDYKITGDLTIKGTTKTIELPGSFSGLMQDPWGNTRAGLSVSGKINRKDWGLNWNAALEAGGVLVGEEVRLSIEMQFTKI